ncbi:MAG TPA: hypothetical protein VFB00_06165 [Terriglobales bacterium]|nr:hypothetical protein [Terriglobales bacterium]
MSQRVESWKNALLNAARTHGQKRAAVVPVKTYPGSEAMAALVRRIFFPSNGLRRTRLLFAAAGRETGISVLCEQAARVLNSISGGSVAMVDACLSAQERKPSQSAGGAQQWLCHSTRITEQVWRMSPWALNETGPPLPMVWPSVTGHELPFDYILYAATVSASEMPLFCRMCDGAVLVLTANRTRREAALRAKEYLLQCGATLLGTVLEGRLFPVPEAIYWRL